MQIAGGPMGFNVVRAFVRDGEKVDTLIGTVSDLLSWAKRNNRLEEIEEKLIMISSPREAIEGMSFDKPRLVGILNVTPDSFSDGGKYLNISAALRHAEYLIQSGADIIDIGGESTRPGAKSVDAEVESERVLPAIKELANRTLVSVDTRKSYVMKRAVDSGAKIINDISGFTADSKSLAFAASIKSPLILMHSKGDPSTMQRHPNYKDVLLDIFDFLSDRISICEKIGISRKRLIIDPGIGFGKNDFHTKRIAKHLSVFHSLGCPILVGFSRKSFIGRWSGSESVNNRLPGSIASVLWSMSKGIQMFRVHDVEETRQAIKIWSHFSS